MRSLIPTPVLLLALAPLFTACSLPFFSGDDRPDAPVAAAPADATEMAGTAPGADADGNVPPPPEAASDGLLGETLAGLGGTAPGNWVMTGLVSETQQGRVETASGGSLDVELRPSGAAPTAGSTISVQAMQALGLPLGQLATLRVYTE
ncbi:hypothetical protein [Pararhodobacter sp. CCB-MM2]|uniref:hypothetical protein n=1 Tax=Pararhodobacter sp. CCB-MM2 TaxID=1786003 RepID=UPI00083195C1|nr:hypothetical protein [Pararhodobacter sp. CCB-MM2]